MKEFKTKNLNTELMFSESSRSSSASKRVNELKEVITAKQACEILDCHRNTLYKLIEQEGLPSFRLTKGSPHKFRRSELLQWIEDKENSNKILSVG